MRSPSQSNLNQRKLKRGILKPTRLALGLISFGLILTFGAISLQLAIARWKTPSPQAILVLEGNTDRIQFAAHFSQTHPTLPIWISGNPEGVDLNRRLLRQANIPDRQVHFDFCATDTVTNFTCNVSEFKQRGIHHVYLITSDYHMSRAQAIAAIVFGSQGIVTTSVVVVSENKPAEAPWRTVRDCLRSIVWLMIGRTGAQFNPDLHSIRNIHYSYF